MSAAPSPPLVWVDAATAAASRAEQRHETDQPDDPAAGLPGTEREQQHAEEQQGLQLRDQRAEPGRGEQVGHDQQQQQQAVPRGALLGRSGRRSPGEQRPAQAVNKARGARIMTSFWSRYGRAAGRRRLTAALGRAAVQRLLQLLLALLGQRGLEHGAAVLARRLDRPCPGSPSPPSGTAPRCPACSMPRTWSWNSRSMPDLVIFPIRAPMPGADGQAEERDEEQQAEQQPPEHAPGRAGARPDGGWCARGTCPRCRGRCTAIASGSMMRSRASRRASSAAASAVVSFGITDGDQVSHWVPFF